MMPVTLEWVPTFRKGQGGDDMSIFQGRILLATDGSLHAQAAARTAGELAEATGSKLHAVPGGTPLRPSPRLRAPRRRGRTLLSLGRLHELHRDGGGNQGPQAGSPGHTRRTGKED